MSRLSDEEQPQPLLPEAAGSRVTGMRERLQFRPTTEQKQLFMRAAALAGQSLPEFMRVAIEEKAHRIIEDDERITLSAEARDNFLKALADPPAPNDRLVELIAAFRNRCRVLGSRVFGARSIPSSASSRRGGSGVAAG